MGLWHDMTIAYRIAQQKYIDDLSGYGAYLVGGRWNLPGTYVLYLAANRSLAYLEYLVHQFDRQCWPINLSISTVEIKDESRIVTISPEQLPDQWNAMQYQVDVQQTCRYFFNKDVLGIKVPSVVVSGEFNFALNPLASDFSSEVSIVNIEKADFDERLKRAFPQ